jgi:hypothetical protein
MKYNYTIPLFFILLFSMKGYSQAPASVKEMIDNKRFVFAAQTMSPQKGGMRTLTPGYTMKVSPDTLVSDLPYIGRAFQAPIGGSDGGMKFTATKFTYTVKEKKKGWTININTKEVSGNPRIILTTFDNGNATIVITSSDRDSISYSGVVSGG